MEKKTAMMEVIEKLEADSKFLNGENDAPTDKAVGQYLKTIADDLRENYLQKEQEQIFLAFVAGDERGTGNIPFNCEQYYAQTYGDGTSQGDEYESIVKKAKKVKCIISHQDGLTVGKKYNVESENEKYYDIYPDDFGHLSGFDKRYFEPANATS